MWTASTPCWNETGQRQEFGVHVPRYYERAYDLFVPNGDAALLMGSYDGLDLAGVFVFKLGEQAWYLYGASRQQERQRMASFGVQWAGLEWALGHGCTSYDLYGIPDEDEAALEANFQERDDGLWGVYRFKRGWGGRVVRSVGAWDRVYNPMVYWLYQAGAESSRRRPGRLKIAQKRCFLAARAGPPTLPVAVSTPSAAICFSTALTSSGRQLM